MTKARPLSNSNIRLDETVNKMVNLKTKEEGNFGAPASFDEVLLDEFFSLVASIASRLTKEDIQHHNSGNSTGQEAQP